MILNFIEGHAMALDIQPHPEERQFDAIVMIELGGFVQSEAPWLYTHPSHDGDWKLEPDETSIPLLPSPVTSVDAVLALFEMHFPPSSGDLSIRRVIGRNPPWHVGFRGHVRGAHHLQLGLLIILSQALQEKAQREKARVL